jgi:hypothetical protein
MRRNVTTAETSVRDAIWGSPVEVLSNFLFPISYILVAWFLTNDGSDLKAERSLLLQT